MIIDLRSDTVTKPTQGMLDAMMNAQVGDDVYKEDPTVNALQEKVAKLFGMEAALFFPSGTMANQTAIKLHTQPGDKLFCDKWAHVYNFEGGGAAFNAGVTCHLIDGDRGMFTAEQLSYSVGGRADIHVPFSSLKTCSTSPSDGSGEPRTISRSDDPRFFASARNAPAFLMSGIFSSFLRGMTDIRAFSRIRKDSLLAAQAASTSTAVGLIFSSSRSMNRAARKLASI